MVPASGFCRGKASTSRPVAWARTTGLATCRDLKAKQQQEEEEER